jgi:hypothetical protein
MKNKAILSLDYQYKMGSGEALMKVTLPCRPYIGMRIDIKSIKCIVVDNGGDGVVWDVDRGYWKVDLELSSDALFDAKDTIHEVNDELLKCGWEIDMFVCEIVRKHFNEQARTTRDV